MVVTCLVIRATTLRHSRLFPVQKNKNDDLKKLYGLLNAAGYTEDAQK